MSVSRRAATLGIGVTILIALAIGVAFLKVPYVALGPGPTYNTLGTVDSTQIIQVNGKPTSTSKGHLNLTTVSVANNLNLFEAMRGWLDPDYAVVPRELVFPPNKSQQEVDAQNRADFQKSQSSAETAALRVLGYPVTVTVSKAAASVGDAVRAGDVVTQVDGNTVTSVDRLNTLLDKHKPGDKVQFTVVRGGQQVATTLTALATKDADGNEHATVPVTFQQQQPHPFKITFKLANVEGPSAGLMFSLGLVDKLDPRDLTGGKFIAGTGTIDDDGNVGPIGGIQMKLIAARRAGARYFLTPPDNCSEAKGATPSGLRLVKSGTLNDALSALEQIRAGDDTHLARC
jgi:PDZ domain-containing protein